MNSTYSRIAFHRASQHVVVVRRIAYVRDILHIEIYTKDGEFVRSTPFNLGQSYSLTGMAVTTEGHIAVVLCRVINLDGKKMCIIILGDQIKLQ